MWGIDSLPRAVHKAQEKAAAQGLTVHYVVLDARNLPQLNLKSDTVTDSGLFHTLSDKDRPVFADTLAAALPPCGKYFMLCFADLEPGNYGTGKVTQQEIRETFRDGWSVTSIRPAVFKEPHQGSRPPCLAVVDNEEITKGGRAVSRDRPTGLLTVMADGIPVRLVTGAAPYSTMSGIPERFCI